MATNRRQRRGFPAIPERAEAWRQLRSAGGRRFERLVVWRQLWLGSALAVAGGTLIVLIAVAAASASGDGRSAAVRTVLSAAVALVLADLEARCYRAHQRQADGAARFVELYQAGAERALSMGEENELWALACRRLRLCSLQRMFAFEHGQRPADDDFLKSAFCYLSGSHPQWAPATSTVALERATRRAS